MREYNRYEEYKDSGVEWIGEIPKSWNQSKYKYYFFSSMGNTILKEDLIVDGSIPIYSATESDDIFGYVNNANVILNKNDFVIPARGNSIGNITLVNSDKATCTQTTIYSKKVNDINKKYIYYFLDGLKEHLFSFTRTAIPQITVKQVSNNNILVPPKIEQQKIASFLEQKTAEIDEIINKKESLINYLEKYKKSVITEAVTKGKLGNKYINEDGELVDKIEMKDSGVEWLGEIPNYWNIKRLKFVVDEINEKWDENSFYEYIGLENIESDGGKVTGTQSSENINSAIKFKKDDVLFNTLRPYLRKCIVAGFEGICTSEMLVLRGDDIFPQLLSHIMLSNKFIELVHSSTYGAKMPRANWDFIGNIYIPIVNKDIQKEIIGFLDFKISSIYNLINKTKQSIEKYKEYKKSLIFEAVTGKIDLRDYELEGGEKLAEHNNSSETERERLSAVD